MAPLRRQHRLPGHAAVSLLVLFGLGWGLRSGPSWACCWRESCSYGFCHTLHGPGGARPVVLTLVGAGALAINLACTLILVRYRSHGGSLTRAAFLSTRNDVLANAAVTTAGMVAARLWPFAWPDLIVGLGVVAMNAGAARKVWVAAREQHGTTA
ncbi:cation diffusion facilitator family transporter [Teichococcus wenyumeiae]|uniref:cation transporter n=1 Tax=Teichococcus wenyumeiae TaxID=2478470 RepID=UPI001F48FB80|nr:cation transporter [Pseudoroseomonas wenyumeiae]